MGIHTLLERMGFVRLRDFGLLLTPDRRVVTTRQVLDDGFGATVVGWEGNDLAMMELPAKAVAVSMAAAPAATSQPIAFAAPLPGQLAAIAVVPPVFTPVAPSPISVEPQLVEDVEDVEDNEPGEDEWEWEIAMARARAAAEEPMPVKPRPQPTPHTTSQWLTAEPLTGPWKEDTAIRSVTQLARASEQQLATTHPRTIIPVPTLPVAADAREITRQLPVPRRFARGTSTRAIANDDETTAVRVRRSS
jgi:hypothetical protein